MSRVKIIRSLGAALPSVGRGLGLWVAILVVGIVQGQGHPSVLVDHYTTAQGLPHHIVNCSVETRDGFEWFGTWHGLARFDGNAFRTLSGPYLYASDPAPRKVETLVEDSCGNLWIKTLDWKLSVLIKQQGRFKSVFDELKPFSRNLQVIKIQADGRGGVLLLTKDKTLLLAHTDRHGQTHVRLLVDARAFVNPYDHRLARPVVQLRQGRASYVDPGYHIYSEEVKGRSLWSLATWQRHFAQKAAEAYCFVDGHGCQWQTTGDAQLDYHDPGTGRHKRIQLSFTGKIVEPVFCDAGANGIFYLSPAGEAVYIDRQTLQAENIGRLPQMADAHPDTHYLFMRMSSDGSIWLTTASSGVYRLSFPPRQFRLMPLPVASQAGIRGMYQLANGEVWVGSRDKNLYVLSPEGRLRQTYSYDRYGIGSVYHIMQDHRGRLWLSTKGDGLVMAVPDASQPGGYRFVHHRHQRSDLASLSGNDVYMTYEDSRHRIWVCTMDGGLNLMYEHDGRISFWNKHHGMGRYPGYGLYMAVRNVAEDRRGRIWVGTIDGLMSFPSHFAKPSQMTFETYKKADVPTLANSDIYALQSDRHGNIWVCGFGGGVGRIVVYDAMGRRPVFRAPVHDRRLPGQGVATLLEDARGTLWMANNQGLTACRLDGGMASYDHYDGFPEVEMEEASALRLRNGELWMGCRQGILAFHPNRMESSDKGGLVYIVSATVNNQSIYSFKKPIISKAIAYADTLVLRHDQSMFTLEFASPGSGHPSRVSWRWRLEGYEAHWHYSSGNRIASYTQVPPGEYVFVVEAIGASHPQVTGSRRVTVIILPPWWATWWARTLYALLFALALFFAVRYARYQLKLKNDIYIQSRIAAFKKSFYMEQQDLQFMERAKDTVTRNLTNSEFDIDLFAEQMGMSHSALFKRIKQLTGASPSDYIKEIKLSHALELLKSTSLSVGDVAWRSGFSDAGYFGKCFRKKYGMSPREYQRNQ